jgi:uncharacterized repeat protein (TIGR03806 family)
VKLELVFDDRQRSGYGDVSLVQSPDGARWYVVRQEGIIDAYPPLAGGPEALTVTVFADGESGLLDLAFDPDWQNNRRAFISYNAREGGLNYSRVAAVQTNDDGSFSAPASPVFNFQQPGQQTNHKGGNLEFGPDSNLYLALGDCANNASDAQNASSYCGKLIRIDTSGGGNHAKVALGFRNPWRWSFDKATGTLWAGDVGQSDEEEIDALSWSQVSSGNPNLGWPLCEGNRVNQGSSCNAFVQPVYTYGRDQGSTVVGGGVYRGNGVPNLVGKYVFADFGTDRVWVMNTSDFMVEELPAIGPYGHPVSFATDAQGEMYLLTISGNILKFVPQSQNAQAESTIPYRLSDTGCVDPQRPWDPGPGLIPYDINVPFWSDGAEKTRWVALPDGTTLHIGDDGNWQFPVGTVFMKQFRLGGRLVETRLFMRHPDGAWGGYSYAWDADGKNATLLLDGEVRPWPEGQWHYPSRQECMQCHNASAGSALGAKTGQMNKDVYYAAANVVAGQLQTLAYIGLLDAPLPKKPAEMDVLPPLDGPATLGERARAYLATNCALCHNPQGGTGVGMDFRYGRPLSQTVACNQLPMRGNLGISDARIIAAGLPEKSVVSARMHLRGGNQMPPIASLRVDEAGTALVDAWIGSLTGCF